jgi:TonB family protein
MAVDSYFKYLEASSCGIPEIKLEGTTKDWKTIYKNAKKLDNYGLQFWTKELLPILEEFINASKGKANKEFWQSIYKWNSNCGNDGVTGWVTKLFPYYYSDNGYVSRNGFRNSLVYPKELPTGIAKVNLNWIYGPSPQPEIYEMEIYAGFLGLQQNKKTKAIKPLIQWAVRDKSSEKVRKYGAVFYTKRAYIPIENSRDVVEISEIVVEEEEDYKLDDDAYLIVEKMPEFPGGETALRKFINSSIKYPQSAKENNIEGKVYVRFCVKRNGKVDKISIAKSVAPVLDNEALRAVSLFPKWKPGTIKGKKVNVWYVVPVNFSLNP